VAAGVLEEVLVEALVDACSEAAVPVVRVRWRVRGRRVPSAGASAAVSTVLCSRGALSRPP
jgi:hypothetical protein